MARLSLLLLLAITSIAAADAPSGTAKVTYLTSASVYVDAGKEEGIREGDLLEVVRNGETVASLLVTYLSSHRAACTVKQSTSTIEVGDAVRFTPAATPAAPPPSAAASGSTKTTHGDWARNAGIRGRAGVRYLWVDDDNGVRISQPALDLKLDGSRVAGSPMDFALDVRARRTSQTFANGTDSSDGENRIYRASASWHASDSGLRLTFGRQFSPSLATVSTFDGIALDVDQPRASFGGVAGTQPDPVTFGYSSEIREYGAYFQLHNLPAERRLWTFTTGLLGSYDEGEVNREFLYLQGQYVGERVSGYLAQEVDYNRGWKVDAGESTISPTSIFGSLRWRAGDHVDLYGGYDNRRSARLYRDRVTPEIEFDDSHRQGAWIGAWTRFASRYGIGVDARSSGGGDAGSADSYGLRLQADRLSRYNLSVRARSTQYSSDRSDGWLHALSLGMTPTGPVHFELTGGIREESHPQDPNLDERLSWVGLDLDVGLGRRWYLVLSAESDTGDLSSTNQCYLSVTYRF